MRTQKATTEVSAADHRTDHATGPTRLPLLPFWAPRANIHGRWKCSSPTNGPNHTGPHYRSLSPTPPGSAPRSYAAVTARLPARQQPVAVDTSRLQQILARAMDFLDSMMHARTSVKQDAHLAQPLFEELAHQAEPVLVELRTANAGLAAAQALSSLPHASGQSLVTQSACTISQPTTQAARPASKLPVGQAGLSPPSPHIWSSSRTLLLLPTDPEVRRWPLSPSDFARRIESALRQAIRKLLLPLKGAASSSLAGRQRRLCSTIL